jgi:pimeloyl-ACP methyl ester carboxylesterase
MSSIKPYKINVPQSKIDRLHKKLELYDLPDELEAAEWEYGAPLADIKKLAEYWKDKYDWRKAEAQLNEMPQFTTDVDVAHFGTFNIHFVHRQSTVKNAIPLIFLHGWPGSFIEVTKILPQLVNGPSDFPSYHLVAPSLVDYGFSSGCPKKGFSIDQHAEYCHKLMQSLGYTKYVAQGGDLGSFVCRLLATKYPDSCVAMHTNFALPREPSVTEFPALAAQAKITPLTDAEKAGLARTEWYNKVANSYMLQHSTKPQTIGYSMIDSPVGLLAWIYEKLHDWTDNYQWSNDEILTWISIYYFSTAGPHATQRIYYAFSHGDEINGERPAVDRIRDFTPRVKIGISRCPKELLLLPKSWNQTLGNIVFEGDHDSGGHFMATEKPDALVSDLRIMFGKGGGAEGVVEGKSGYD